MLTEKHGTVQWVVIPGAINHTCHNRTVGKIPRPFAEMSAGQQTHSAIIVLSHLAPHPLLEDNQRCDQLRGPNDKDARTWQQPIVGRGAFE